jgi:predicted ester cyclase
MDREAMVELFDRHEAAEAVRDAEAAAATYHEEGYYLNVPLGAGFEGRQGVMLNYLGIFTAFPDFEAERRLLVAGDDFLYEEGVFRGTFQGPFLHIEPTGRRAEMPFASYIPFREGLMLAEHVYYDGALLAEQLGVSLEDVSSLRKALSA